MKYYSTLFLSTALLGATLLQPVTALAETTQTSSSPPTEVVSPPIGEDVESLAPTETNSSSSAIPQEEQEPTTEAASTPPPAPTVEAPTLTTQLQGQTLSIFYQRSAEQQGQTIQYAVWSDEKGQDDLRWYEAGETQTDIALQQHKGYGTYHIHAYIRVGGKQTFLAANQFQLTKPQPNLTTSLSEAGFATIHIQNLPLSTTEVRVPTWSDEGGQDDITWYHAQRNPDGSYSLKVKLADHHFKKGLYHAHLYSKEDRGNLTPQLAASFVVEDQHLPKATEARITVSSLNPTKGSYQLSVEEPATGKAITRIEAATWSTDNQSNIKWRALEKKGKTYSTSISITDHHNLTGNYHNHVYITYTDGSRVGYRTDQVPLTAIQLPATATIRFASAGTFALTIKQAPSNGSLSYAVWSDAQGQDDLRWYEGNRIADKTFTGTIPLSFHKGVGLYHCHVYQDGKGVGAYTFSVSAKQRAIEPNTYPIGQCTWGVKEVAPWVGNHWGNAAQWLSAARRAGFQIGQTPRVGAVAVWTNSYYGHVAYVTEVQSPHRIRVQESNYAGKQYVGDFRGWFNPSADGVAGYIYPK